MTTHHRICRVPGCGAKAVSRFAVYCTSHKGRWRGHGHAEQQGITKGELAPYTKAVQKRIARNQDSPAWERLDDLWGQLVSHSRDTLAAHDAGTPGSRYEHLAAQEVVKLTDQDQVEARQVVVTALAMFAMQELEPEHKFRSDQAFRTQLVRRVRGLGDVHTGETYSRSDGRMKRTYSHMPPKAAAVLGQWLVEIFGGAGLHLARLEKRDQEAKSRAREELHSALGELR